MTGSDHKSQGLWKYRRRYLIAVTGFTMAAIGFSMFLDTKVAETVVTMGFTALIAFTGSYVFGAVWDHRNARQAVVELETERDQGYNIGLRGRDDPYAQSRELRRQRHDDLDGDWSMDTP